MDADRLDATIEHEQRLSGRIGGHLAQAGLLCTAQFSNVTINGSKDFTLTGTTSAAGAGWIVLVHRRISGELAHGGDGRQR